MEKLILLLPLLVVGCSCSTETYRSETTDSIYVNYYLVDIPIPPYRERLKLIPISLIGYKFISKDSTVTGTIDTGKGEIDISVTPKPVRTPLPEITKKTETKTEIHTKEQVSIWEKSKYIFIGIGLAFILLIIGIFLWRMKIV